MRTPPTAPPDPAPPEPAHPTFQALSWSINRGQLAAVVRLGRDNTPHHLPGILVIVDGQRYRCVSISGGDYAKADMEGQTLTLVLSEPAAPVRAS